MKDYDNSLSERLRYALKLLKVSQTDLAKQINIKPQAIQYLCASNSQKSKFTFEIADALNIDFSWLATGKGTPPNKVELTKNERMIPILSFTQIREWKIYGTKIDLSKITNWIPISEEISQDSFALILNDKSMAPRFDLNTVIIIDPTPVIMDTYVPNYYVLVYLAQEDFVVFRQLNIVNNTKLFIPINKNLYKDTLLQEKDIVLGTCKEARWNI